MKRQAKTKNLGSSRRVSLDIALSITLWAGACFFIAGGVAASPQPGRDAAPGSDAQARTKAAGVTKAATKKAATKKAATNAEVAAITKAVLRETSALRELAIRWPVQSGAQPRATIERMVVRELNRTITAREMRASELALKKLGMVPANFHLRSFYIGLMTEQVAGYYDPRTRKLYLADWIDAGAQRVVAVHELTHALQDQHFNLRRFEKWPRGESDSKLAAVALVEGDATLAMTQYITRNPLRLVPLLKTVMASGGASEKVNAAPRALRESLIFPYQQGMEWATQVYARGGWKLLSKAFRDLPQSTEQILHADKYFRRDKPVRVSLTDVSKVLGRGWRRIEGDVNGEWGLYLILDEYLKNKAESQRAAAGWGGDRYAVYEGPKGQTMIAQMTAWDTVSDAIDFERAYAKRTGLRYGVKLAKSIWFSGVPRGSQTWRTSSGWTAVEWRDRRVLILEGAPGDRLPKLTRTLWK